MYVSDLKKKTNIPKSVKPTARAVPMITAVNGTLFKCLFSLNAILYKLDSFFQPIRINIISKMINAAVSKIAIKVKANSSGRMMIVSAKEKPATPSEIKSKNAATNR